MWPNTLSTATETTLDTSLTPSEAAELSAPSDAELEAIVRGRVPATLRSNCYPRTGWHKVGGWLLRWAWVGFLAYLSFPVSALVPPIFNGQPITGEQVSQALLIGRLLPFINHVPLFALVVPLLLLVLVILAGRWAHQDTQREKEVVNRQNEWVRHEVTRERAHLDFVEAQEQEQRRQQETAAQQQAIEYELSQVADLDPNRYLARYVASVYLPRHEKTTGQDAETQARDVLRAAKEATFTAPQSLGILVIGRPTLGKTRFAWEAMQEVLRDALFVRWPHGATHPFDFAALRDQLVALWLDNLQEFASTDIEANAITDLPRRFAECQSRLVIVATCRDGHDESTVREKMSRLTSQLVTICLADITPSETNQLVSELAEQHVIVSSGSRDGTPGALLLGVDAMRNERYPHLTEQAKDVLHTLKLLRSAGTYDYPPARVQAVGHALFTLPTDAGTWRKAVEGELVREDFLRLLDIETASGLYSVEPVADVYLEQAIRDYPPDQTALSERWPSLQGVLFSEQDLPALFALGNAYINLKQYNEALAAYEQVLILDIETYEAWYNKGNTLAELGRSEEALAAYDQAIALNPQDATAWYSKGNTLVKLDRSEEALAAFDQAIALNPQYATAWYNKGTTLGLMEQYAEALTAFDQVLMLKPQDTAALHLKALILQALGQEDQAAEVEHMAQALENTTPN